MLPVGSVPAEGCYKKGKYSQYHGKGNVPGNIGTKGKERDQAHQVIQQDEKEDGQ